MWWNETSSLRAEFVFQWKLLNCWGKSNLVDLNFSFWKEVKALNWPYLLSTHISTFHIHTSETKLCLWCSRAIICTTADWNNSNVLFYLTLSPFESNLTVYTTVPYELSSNFSHAWCLISELCSHGVWELHSQLRDRQTEDRAQHVGHFR